MSLGRLLPRVLSILVLSASLAHAGEPLTDDEAGKRHYLSAQAYFDHADYPDALKEFQESYRLSKYPAILYQIGQCQERLGQAADAIATFQRYLTADPSSKRRASVETTIANLKQRLEHAPAPDQAPTTAPGKPVTAAPSEPPPTSAPAPAPARRSPWLAPGLVLGLTVALAVTGAALVGSVQPEYDTLMTTSPADPDYGSRIDALESRANAGYAMFGLAGAAAAVDVVLWAVAARHRGAARAMLVPVAGGATAAFSTSF